MLPPATSQESPLPPPPRAVRLRARVRQQVWFLRLVSLPFLAAGIWLVGVLLADPLTAACGKEIVARIEEVRPDHRWADGRHFRLTYSYDSGDGIRRVGYGRIDTAGAKPPEPGQAVAVRVFTVTPFDHARLKTEDSSASGFCCGGLFVLVWCDMAAVFAAAAWFHPNYRRWERQFVRDAQATVGSPTRKASQLRGKTVQYEVYYRYRSADGVMRVGGAVVPQEVFESLHNGQPVVVLYKPDHPDWSLLYEASAFEVA